MVELKLLDPRSTSPTTKVALVDPRSTGYQEQQSANTSAAISGSRQQIIDKWNASLQRKNDFTPAEREAADEAMNKLMHDELEEICEKNRRHSPHNDLEPW